MMSKMKDVKHAVSVALAAIALATTALGAPAAAAQTTADASPTDLYVVLQGEATGVRAVADDGKDMYLEFGIIIPGELRAFDGDGRRLDTAASGNLLGVPGLHDGILLRLGTATSFVSVKPGAKRAATNDLADSRELREVRAALLTKGPVYQAMQRALQRVVEREGSEPDVGTAAPRPVPAPLLSGRGAAPDGLADRGPK